MAIIRKLQDSEAYKLVSHVRIESYIQTIKELIHNSTAAGAQTVSIILDWKSLSILIRDDGRGISHLAEFLESKKRDYTGNLLNALNFVSRLTIVSKVKDQEPLILKNNKIEKFTEDDNMVPNFFKVDPISISGTVVTVTNLFENIPMRRKAMLAVPHFKQLHELKLRLVYLMTEFPRIVLNIDQIDNNLNHLTNLIHLPTRNSYPDLLNLIWGDNFITDYESIAATTNGYTMLGIISKFQSQSNQYQFILLNTKPFYLSSLETKQLIKLFGVTYPVYLLSIKSTSIIRPDQIFDLICKTVISYLSSQNQTVNLTSLPERLSKSLSPEKVSPKRKLADDLKSIPTSPLFKKSTNFKSISNIDDLRISKHDLRDCDIHIIKQIDKKFILATINIQHQPNLIILDQHACDERLRVEDLFKQYLSLIESIELVDSIKLECTTFEEQLFQHYQENLNFYGVKFDIVDNSILLTHLPPILFENLDNSNQIERDIIQYLYDLSENKISKSIVKAVPWYQKIPHLPRFVINSINSKSCQSAVKFGDELTKDEMEDMIARLIKCHWPFQCAHGRPTMVRLANLEAFSQNQKGK